MLLWYIALFFIALILGLLDVSPAFTFLVIAVYIILSIPYVIPIIWSRDTEKMMNYLKKSRNAYYKFLYQFLNGDEEEAEKIAQGMREGRMKDMALVMLHIHQKKHREAKLILKKMKDGLFKNYYLAAVLFEEGDMDGYDLYKKKVTDADYRKWLEIEEAVRKGNRTEGLKMLDEQIARLRGMKLLSAVHYRNEFLKNSISQGEGKE
ncbi:hypothetical protein D1B31_05180 [Neobacillus notoginsengisoli]|uniref:Uncharacterized protein n=1 Tax=Neobacillus notoginsengisoli TaxID=1578198 RepID=A0A417YWV6_9BACI|nr:hypothetical protein [Neobacillus notoginsengisoli]RHW42036.1 hypothetical protein D1B31_05180 [Neobacillus notoginsengisoli]